jgi:hypothetical protein
MCDNEDEEVAFGTKAIMLDEHERTRYHYVEMGESRSSSLSTTWSFSGLCLIARARSYEMPKVSASQVIKADSSRTYDNECR